jgi:Ca2+:H+ antiporter
LPPAATNGHDDSALTTAEIEKPKTKVPVVKRFNQTAKKIALHSWVNLLLVFVPIGVASHFAGLNPSIVFAMNAIAIIPLAGLLTYATESVAHRLGDTLGALLNVSFGNAVELIILYVLPTMSISVNLC